MLPDAPQTPEAALVTAILMQAYRDLFLSVINDSGATSASQTFTSQPERDQAITFLTEQTGAMARHRNALCALIGWDGNLLATRVRAMMEGDDFPPSSPDATPLALARHATAVERLRERWQAMRAPHLRKAA